jgi:hypothetical protein
LQKLKLLKKIEVALEELGELPASEKPGRSQKALLKALPSFLANVKGSTQEIEAFIRQQKQQK